MKSHAVSAKPVCWPYTAGNTYPQCNHTQTRVLKLHTAKIWPHHPYSETRLPIEESGQWWQTDDFLGQQKSVKDLPAEPENILPQIIGINGLTALFCRSCSIGFLIVMCPKSLQTHTPLWMCNMPPDPLRGTCPVMVYGMQWWQRQHHPVALLFKKIHMKKCLRMAWPVLLGIR